MDLALFLTFSLIICAIIYALISSFFFRRLSRLPPGPYPIPIIGNIHQLGKNLNQSLAKLSKIYGPFISLKLGTRTAIVVSSPAVAREILQKNDQTFSGRSVPVAAHAYDHHKFSIIWLPASPRWRNLRKISKEQMFSSQRLDASQSLRQEKLKELGQYLHTCATKGQAVNIGQAAFTTMLNFMSNTLFSVDFATFDSNSSQEFKEIVCGVLESGGTPNLADHFPVLKFLDPQGLFKRNKFYRGRLFDVFDGIIKQRLQERSSSQDSPRKQDLLEAVLDQMTKDEVEFSINQIKHLLMDLFTAGTDTSSITVEWGMTELLRSPEKMAKARAELREVIGKRKTIEESDISSLPYLQALVKEIFRLHPAASITSRICDADVEINGYLVPKGARILINIRALGRDSRTWSDPEMFLPERFLQSEVDVRGQHFELIPFGGGRRICVGFPLAYRMVHLMLAFLIHDIEWKLEEGMGPEDIDVKENVGLTISKAVPLKAIPVELNLNISEIS